MNHEGLLLTDRLTLYLRRAGEGRPLLFLGGSNFDMRLRAPVFDSALVGPFEVAAYEPRGLGRSDAPDGPWTMADYAADALAAMDALGWERPDILGESFGAMTALELAIRHPDRIGRLALMAGAPGGVGGVSYPIHDLLLLPPRERALATLRVQDLRFAALEAEAPAEADSRLTARLEFEERFLGDPRNAAGYPRLLKARAGHDCWDRLGRITAPTLIIAGRHDGQAPPALSEAMAGRIAGARLAVFDGGHHVGFATPAPVMSLLTHWGVHSFGGKGIMQ